MSDIVNEFLDEIPAASAKGSTSGNGKYESQLSAETIQVLDLFVELLVTEGKSKGTAQSYRSGVAKSLALRQPWSQQSSDQHSAARAFKRLMGAG